MHDMYWSSRLAWLLRTGWVHGDTRPTAPGRHTYHFTLLFVFRFLTLPMPNNHRPAGHRDTFEDDDELPQPPVHFHRPPQGHGPKPLYPPSAPVFVRASASSLESSHEHVNTGTQEQDINKRGAVLDFWKNLDWNDQALSTSVASTSKSSDCGPPLATTTNGDSVDNVATSRPDSEITSTTDAEGHSSVPSSLASTPPPSSRPVRMPSSQWFIRRALSTRAKQSSSPQDRAQSSAHTLRSTSVASLLDNLAPPGSQPDASTATSYFHLDQSNKGWKLLEKNGWSGQGGLGRPSGWKSNPSNETTDLVKSEQDQDRLHHESDAVIDLTGDTDDDDDDADDQNDHGSLETVDSNPRTAVFGEQQLSQAVLDESRPPPLIGPGRVAPIPTILKSDRAGIGHSRSHQHRRVTHSAHQVAAVAAAAKRGKVVTAVDGHGGGKRRARLEAKRDKEERARWREELYR